MFVYVHAQYLSVMKQLYNSIWETNFAKTTWFAKDHGTDPEWFSKAYTVLKQDYAWQHCSVQFIWFDNLGMLRLQCYGGSHASPGPNLWGMVKTLHPTHLSYCKRCCSNLLFWYGEGGIPSTKNTKVLVGFESRTEPKLRLSSHITSAPPPPIIMTIKGIA